MEGAQLGRPSRLHRKDYISDPASKAKSVLLTEAGAKRSQELLRNILRNRSGKTGLLET